VLADLHRHLDGSLRESTIRELAGRTPDPDELRFRQGMGLVAALAKFDFTLSLLQTPAAVRRVAAEICEDAITDGVTTLEIRFAPQLHLKDGARLDEIAAAAVEGAAGRAGIIACGLYGEPPSVLESLVELDGIVGIDLAGGPAPGDAYGVADYAKAYRRAAERGLGRTVHAGEGRHPREIRAAIELLGAERIGHGTSLLLDPAVRDLVIERGVTIEACPTSNVHTNVIASLADHPLPDWLRVGVKACVNTDNTLFSDVTSSEEHRRARTIPGMDDGLLALAVRLGHEAAFGVRASRSG
jgi:adenosine deaminase